MSTAGRVSSQPDLQTFHANGGADTGMVGAALGLACPLLTDFNGILTLTPSKEKSKNGDRDPFFKIPDFHSEGSAR